MQAAKENEEGRVLQGVSGRDHGDGKIQGEDVQKGVCHGSFVLSVGVGDEGVRTDKWVSRMVTRELCEEFISL